ncbi:hypothetical protein UPA6_A0066 [Ureaplasma parvum serovar 6 str. ATCC 27818]|nr:hypothetical protein UPA6_A0066 [Ureaplasma parvum serovar 6 str. ATCC 27818]
MYLIVVFFYDSFNLSYFLISINFNTLGLTIGNKKNTKCLIY